MMEEQHEAAAKLSLNQRREETDRAFRAIMEEERRSRLERSMRLRRMRLARTDDGVDPRT